MQTTDHAGTISATSPLKCVSTDGIKLSERREYWESHTEPLFGPLAVELLGSQAFNASFEHTGVGNLTFCRLSSSVPHRAVRTPAFARRDDRGFVKAVFLKKGSSVLEQNGRTTVLRAGDWSIYDTAKPYVMTVPTRMEVLLLLIPRERFVARNFDLQNLVARRFPGRRGLGKLIWTLIPATLDQLPELRDRSSHDVADMIAQMTRLALLDFAAEHASPNSQEVLRERIKDYIENHLGDPDLSITRLASVAGCTKRYLHMIFQPEGVSISGHILRLRLERCRENLVSPACAHRSITDIAYSWGFNSSNHFSRCFKEAFGVSPRNLRASMPAWTGSGERSRLF